MEGYVSSLQVQQNNQLTDSTLFDLLGFCAFYFAFELIQEEPRIRPVQAKRSRSWELNDGNVKRVDPGDYRAIL